MSKEKPVHIYDEVSNQCQPWIKYLVENYNDPNKVNSCLDVASENIRMLSAVVDNCKQFIRDFEMLKKMTLRHEEIRQRKLSETQSPISDSRQESCISPQEDEDENTIE